VAAKSAYPGKVDAGFPKGYAPTQNRERIPIQLKRDALERTGRTKQ
jgi:hypothetical protein